VLAWKPNSYIPLEVLLLDRFVFVWRTGCPKQGRRMGRNTICLLLVTLVILTLVLAHYIATTTTTASSLFVPHPQSSLDPDMAFLSLNLGYIPNALSEDVGAVESTWARCRRYAVIIDAGSSGSRVLIYSWKDALPTGMNKHEWSKIEPGLQSGVGWHFKQEPGWPHL
jgi:hypothetical protein